MRNSPSQKLSAETFYDITSEFYEQMINFEKNLELRVKAYKNIFSVPGNVADLGCGIGLDSIALAMNGHNVTAFDISDKMISVAKINAEKYGVKIDTQALSLTSVPKEYNNKFNYIVCVGNTIAHLNEKELSKAFNKMYKMLVPGGKIFVHILNYDLIKRENKRINNISVGKDKTIIRFYDFMRDYISFNILSFNNLNPTEQKLISTKQFPHKRNNVASALRNIGYKKYKAYSNFSGSEFLSLQSKDLFFEANK